LSGKSIKDILKEFGLADNQAKIYIFLAKHGVLKGGEIAKQAKIQKAVVYRTLKVLQRKGFVESTLEFPARYIAVPFDTILDQNIKTKKEEALQIEKSKKSLLEDWKNISKGVSTQQVEKFNVIEGNQKIYTKIYQMIKQTKTQIITATTIQGLFQADKYGVFEAIHNHPKKTKIKFRFITDLTKPDLPKIKALLNRMKGVSDLRGRNPDLGLALFPRMVIRDNEEICLFISDKENENSQRDGQTCLCTNSKSIIQSFSGVFEDLWKNSTDIKQKIKEIETGKLPIKTQLIKDPISAEKMYNKILTSAKKEILIITSTEGLNKVSKNKDKIQNLSKKGVQIKIMAPITGKNLGSAQKLLNFIEVRHISEGYLETTIIDNQHLFQLKYPITDLIEVSERLKYKNSLYTNDSEQVKQTEKRLLRIWKTAQIPLAITMDSTNNLIIDPKRFSNTPTGEYMANLEGVTHLKDQSSFNGFAEKDVIDMIMNAKKGKLKKTSKKVIRQYGTTGRAIIRPPKIFSLPEIAFNIYHFDKHSTNGAEDSMIISVSHNTSNGKAYFPAAFIGDNPKALDFIKIMFKHLIPDRNCVLAEKDELQMRVHGNNFFCGWTRSISLSEGVMLPAASILLEGYGNIRTSAFSVGYPSGYRMDQVGNYLESFVTFFHPTVKYSGPGTDSILGREIIMEFYQP